MDNVIEIISKVEWPTIIAMAVMFWRYNAHLDKKFDKIDQRFDKIDQRFDKIDDRLNNLDKRLVAVETILHMKECCILKEDKILKKVE